MPRAEPYPWHVVSAHTEQVGSGYLVSRWCQRGPWITVWEAPPGRHPAKPRLSHVSAYVFAGTRTRRRPAFVPRTTGRRQETTGTAGASNPQVRDRIPASSQVARSAPRTLSRWRHGFKSRRDYKSKLPGQSTTPEATGSLNRDSIAEYPENIPSQIMPSG